MLIEKWYNISRNRTGNSSNRFNNDGRLHSTSSFEYYYEAKQFSEEISELLKGITQANAVDEEGKTITFSVNTGEENIFEASNSNNPLISGSTFDENRMAVIRKSIETNLVSAIANYNLYIGSNYEFSLPVLKDTEWEKITNNVAMNFLFTRNSNCHKYYNNYCVITSDNKKR